MWARKSKFADESDAGEDSEMDFEDESDEEDGGEIDMDSEDETDSPIRKKSRRVLKDSERSPMSLFKMKVDKIFAKVIERAGKDFAISGTLTDAPTVVISVKVRYDYELNHIRGQLF